MGTIYAIVNEANGKCYVGSTVRLNHRYCSHLSDLRRGVHRSTKLMRAWLKYGPNVFWFVVLESCCASDLMEREKFWIDTLQAVRAGYNARLVPHTNLGYVASDETRQKISAAKRGRSIHQPPRSASVRSGDRLAKSEKFVAVSGIHQQTGDTIQFICLKDAERAGFRRKEIRKCCAGVNLHHAGYRWSYA